MPKFEVHLTAVYEFEAADDEAAYLMAVKALRRDIPADSGYSPPIEWTAFKTGQ